MGLDAEPLSDTVEVVDRDILFRPLYSTQIGPVEARLLGKAFLRPPFLSTKQPHIAGWYVSQGALGCPFHPRCYWRMSVLTLPVLRDIPAPDLDAEAQERLQ